MIENSDGLNTINAQVVRGYRSNSLVPWITDANGDAAMTEKEYMSTLLMLTLHRTESTDNDLLRFAPMTEEKAVIFVKEYAGKGFQEKLQTYVNTLCSVIDTEAYEGQHGIGKTHHAIDCALTYNAYLVKLSGYISNEEELELFGVCRDGEFLFAEELISASDKKEGEKSWHLLQKNYFVRLDQTFSEQKDLIVADRGPVTRLLNWLRDPNIFYEDDPFKTTYFHPNLNYERFGSVRGLRPSDFEITVPIPRINYVLSNPYKGLSADKASSNESNRLSHAELIRDMYEILEPRDKMTIYSNHLAGVLKSLPQEDIF